MRHRLTGNLIYELPFRITVARSPRPIAPPYTHDGTRRQLDFVLNDRPLAFDSIRCEGSVFNADPD